MNNAQEPVPQPSAREPLEGPEDSELDRARELLARTVRFLTHCAEDPEEALRTQDPRQLVRELEVLARAGGPAPKPQPLDELPEPRTIPLHRRRSA